MGKVRYKYSPQRVFENWVKAMTEPEVVVEINPSAEELELEAIADKLREDFPEYPYVARDIDFDGNPSQFDPNYLRVRGLEIAGDKVIFTFDTSDNVRSRVKEMVVENVFGQVPDEETGVYEASFDITKNTKRSPESEIVKFFGSIGFHHFSNSGCKNLKGARYALYETSFDTMDEFMEREGYCRIAVLKEPLMKLLEMEFTSKIIGELKEAKDLILSPS